MSADTRSRTCAVDMLQRVLPTRACIARQMHALQGAASTLTERIPVSDEEDELLRSGRDQNVEAFMCKVTCWAVKSSIEESI